LGRGKRNEPRNATQRERRTREANDLGGGTGKKEIVTVVSFVRGGRGGKVWTKIDSGTRGGFSSSSYQRGGSDCG